MTAQFRMSVALVLAAFLAGCASPPPAEAPSAVVTSPRMKLLAADRVNAVTVGKSTRADVLAALGETLVISFDNGYEVWVYRFASDAPVKGALTQRLVRRGPEKLAAEQSAEFVILFSPSGVVAKTRIRPAPESS
jgi:hypothetical protein